MVRDFARLNMGTTHEINNEIKWSAYMEVPNSENPILLNPLSWKTGDQYSNLKEMANFFINNTQDKTNILIYKSQCGSGKSLTLLNLANISGKAIIVVPFKNLQRQYYDDYFTGKNKYVLKKDGTKLKVSVLLGRNNFPCRWLHEEYDKQQKIIEEAKKAGQIVDVNDFILKSYQIDNTCSNRFLPCTRTLKSLRRGRKEARWVVGSQCPFWIPTPLPREIIYNWQMRTEGKEDIEDFYEEEEYDYLSPYRKILGLDEDANIDDIDRQFHKLAIRCHPDVNKSPWAEEQFKKISGARDILTGKNISGIGNQQLLKENLEKEKKCITRLDKIKERLKCSKIKYYNAVDGQEYGVFIRDEFDKEGKACQQVCPYYQQFYSYVDSDVIVMNDAKWNIETRIGRKPKSSLEAMDEGDYWLDRQSETIEIKRYLIDKIYPFDEKIRQIKANTLYIFDNFFNKLVKDINSKKEDIVDAKEYKELFLTIAKCINECLKFSEDEKYEEILIELATIIKYIDRASLSYVQGKRDETRIIKVYIPYPDNILRELFKLSSKNIIITSGTMHSNYVLANLFGINADNYSVHILDGRKDSPGKLFCIKPQTGLARVTYSVYQNPAFKEHYNKTLNYILDQLKIVVDKKTGKQGEGKILVLTPAKKYADGIRNRPDVFVDFAKEKIKEDDTTKANINTSLNDYVDKTLTDIRKIKPTDIQLDGDVYRTPQQIIISTRLVRGADLRDDKCRAIVMTKWPTPDVSDGYFQALLKRFGEKIYWAIIQDKAEREAIQYVSRGLRHDDDWEFFSSPDETAFNRIYTIFREMKLN